MNDFHLPWLAAFKHEKNFIGIGLKSVDPNPNPSKGTRFFSLSILKIQT